MRTVRIVAWLVAAILAAGPTLLDRCLISCHDEPSSESAVPSCHEHQVPEGVLSVHGVSACGHDHDGLPADATTVVDARLLSARALAIVAVVTPICVLTPPVRSVTLTSQPVVQLPSYSPTLVQLRV